MYHSDDSEFYRKVVAVNLVLSGTSVANIATANRLCRATVSGWAKKVDEQGFDALRETPREGRISKLSHEQYCELDSVIQQDPRNFGYNVWDGNTRGDLIFKKYGISFKIRHCQTIFHKLGFSRIRPQTYPSKNEEHSEEREAFKKMAEIRSDENLIAVYQDEVHFQAQTTVTAAWFKKGTDPKGKKHAVVMDNASLA